MTFFPGNNILQACGSGKLQMLQKIKSHFPVTVLIMNVNIVCADRCNCWKNGTGKEKKISA